MLDRVEYPETGGIYIYLKGVLHPVKGFPTPEAVGANNIAKRLFIGYAKFFAMPEVVFSSITFLLLPWKRKIKVLDRWLHGYSALANITLMPYYLKEIRYTPICRELWKFTSTFLQQLGIPKENAEQFAKVFATLVEYDTAYRYRMQDIFSETNQELLKENPRREIKKLLEIFKQREPTMQVISKFSSIVSLLSMILVLPKIKRAFRKALDAIEFRKMQQDAADSYHCLRLDRYLFGGRRIEERMGIYMALHGNNPPQSIRPNIQ